MSKRNELGALSKKLPPSAEIARIIEELRDGSDIAAAITGAAIVEARLEMVLRAKFRTKRPDLVSAIFENRGPLSDFNSKILIAEAFGYITAPMAEELQIIRAVRNAFAHAKQSLSFSHAAVEKKARSSVMLTAMEKKLSPVPGYDRGLPSTLGAYLLIVKIMLIIFDTLETPDKLADEAIHDALAEAPTIVTEHEAEVGEH